MKPDVVDSSVVVKWFVPEVLTAEAARLRSCGVPLHSPDFLDVEVAAIGWKKRHRGVMTRSEADYLLLGLASIPVTRHPTTPLVAPAFDVADRTGRTVYDFLYLALAKQLGGVMVTADEKLANSLTSTPWASSVLKLQDLS